MITIREYAKQKNVSYEAVRRQIIKYRENELMGHIILEGRTQLLDDYAVQFLDEKRQTNKVMVMQVEKDETIKHLEAENKALYIKLTSAYEKLMDQDETIKRLEAENKRLLEQKEGSEEQNSNSAAEPSASKPWWKFWQN